MAPELAITPASPWLAPAAAGAASGAARRGPGWRFWALLGGVLTIAIAGTIISARGLRPMAPHEPYRVSVAVDFKPYDPALWAIMNAEDYDAALALDPTLPSPDSVNWTDATAAPETPIGNLREEAYVGPPAKAYAFRGVTPVDRQRAHYCLTAAVYYEAASETDDGMRGVAQTVLNRVRHPSFPNTVCGVVFQGSQRAGVCQFTFSCDGAMARAPSRANWARASRIAAEALAGKVFPSVGLATHYHTQAIWPRWGKSLVMTNIVGAHIFHRWRGRWGMPDAFRAPYAGREPVPGPYMPVAQQLAILSGRAPAAADAATALLPAGSGSVAGPLVPPIAAPAPIPSAMAGGAAGNSALPPPSTPRRPAEPQRDYTDQRLNQSGQVRDEFRGSGEWIRK